ncbi:MAG: glycoside hydrolase family 3 C-terminal domain-containing protein [Bacteroidetes bacterium]|nr:glycoside hydrolase family 3 C-terminal domain-containing protein [Bacteroidota bacterium]
MRNIKTSRAFLFLIPVIILVCFLTSCKKWTETEKETFSIVTNKGGQTLGYSPASGVKLIIDKGFAFKDLNKNGELDKYEDWRLTVDERAKDLASNMSVEQISGLMLYSAHQAIPASGGWFGGGTYGGKKLAESEANSWDLSDQQIDFLTNDNLRHVLITSVESPEVAARWNNNAQALVEGIGMGIPANNSSDPRHRSIANTEYNAGAGGDISMWHGSLGLAATFDPGIMKKFGEIASIEYRALGIATALSPQIDLATDPRWGRVNGTFGEDPQLATDMARAYVDGFQTSPGSSEISGGWGYQSVNAMVKHWPGGGSGEGGRDAHFGYGKYAVYPGNAFNTNLIPFIEGAFKLEGKTGMATAVMPYYTISFNQDTLNGENVGNAYSKYILTDLLRIKYNFDGVVCTDWGITSDESPDITNMMGGGRCWGVEEKFTVATRHYKIIMAGVDQFGGNNDADPVIEAYNIGVQELGEPAMRARFEESAVRLLKNIFRVGLFENPYLDREESVAIVGKAEYMDAGYDAQVKSVVMLKNRDKTLPLEKNKTVFVPKKYTPAGRGWFGNPTPESNDYPVSIDIVKKYFNVTDNPDEADYAIVFINSPNTGSGYSAADAEAGGNGYVPKSLQYGAYTAKFARDPSIAGDPRDVLNRTYKGKTITPSNTTDLGMVLDTKKAMNGKPVIVSLNMSNPAVFGEFEKETDAIVVNFGVQVQAILDILTGAAEPSGLLPMQMPADMKTVEEQYEDVPHDMKCYADSEGNTYDFAFGLNWAGIISDARTEKYKK